MLLAVSTTDDHTIPPSSPPIAEYDISVASASPSEPRGRLPQLGEQLLSPETARLPPPRTPASTRSRYRDNSSEYYTAAWGSPYERSLSPTGSARTALSEQVPSEDPLESSPIHSFGLEHLVPSRLSALSLPLPRLSRSRSATFEASAGEEEGSHTPRSRTKRWVQLPQRQYSERTHWWSDESQGTSDRDQQAQSVASTSASASTGSELGKQRGHKLREENRTLNQRDFLDSVRSGQTDEMSDLYASRWAATPPPDRVDEGSEDSVKEESEQDPDLQKTPIAARGNRPTVATDTPPSESVDAGRQPLSPTPGADRTQVKEDPLFDTSKYGAVEEPTLTPVDTQELDRPALPRGSTADTSRLEPPRSRRRVSWRGKNCIISIPNVDFEALGKPMPQTRSETQERMKHWESLGYNVGGFDLTPDDSPDPIGAHARPIYPDESEQIAQARERRPRVLMPDLNRLKVEAERLIEQRLAALGVSVGGDEPPLPPPPARQALPEMSRQHSGQYPPLPFSPPLPTGSGGNVARPSLMRGHSHTMSVASPISPGIGPFGHMHRHSTFSGSSGFPHLQTQHLPQQGRQPPLSAMQTFSPQKPFDMAGFPRGGSPAQLAALRGEFGGPGSPFNQQMLAMPSPQEYSRGLMQDQRSRQHAYSQSMHHQPMQGLAPFVTQMPSVHQTPGLPELPEEDDEEELREPAPAPPAPEPEPPAYVPPHKRASINADVAVPTPTRGHQHNISEGLERDILEAELRHEAEKRNWIEVIESGEESNPSGYGTSNTKAIPTVQSKVPGASQPGQTGLHGHKKSASRFNVAAPAFTFNPSASFQHTSPAYSFGMPDALPSNTGKLGHARQASSGTLNVAAPAFKPSNPTSMPKSDFSFSANGPAFKPDAPPFEPLKSESGSRTIVDDLPSIFGKVSIPDIVKPARRSKAVAIVPPEQPTETIGESSEEYEDEEGRIAQGDDRLKRQRKVGDDGDEIPRFAKPTPIPAPVGFAVKGSPSADRNQSDTEDAIAGTERTKDDADAGSEAHLANSTQQATVPQPKASHDHKPSSSLSALARPFQPPGTVQQPHRDQPDAPHERSASNSDMEEGEIREHDIPVVSPVRDLQKSFGGSSGPHMSFEYPASERIDRVAHPEPSFDEIDAVMRQLNETDLTEVKSVADDRAMSPLPELDEQPMPGVTYLPEWSRSEAPSPSPRRRQALEHRVADSSFTVHERAYSGEHPVNGWPGVTRLNKADDVPTSDWSGVLSPPDEERLQQRSAFFDSHIDDLIGKVVERRLLPLEESLRSIQRNVVKRSRSADGLHPKRTSSTAESDADDEDDLSDERRNRPISRGRDKRVDQIKAAVIEAIREQSPRRSQSSYDISDLHSALADMKVSFARAASASLDLEDVRVVVEDALRRQSQALVPIATAESTQAHKREMSELEGKWRETLAGALEEANHRRDVEERAVETQRMLRLAEEELTLLRDSSRDEDGRLAAMEDERRELLERCEMAEDAKQRAQDHEKDLEAENEALLATLEEYRTSSSKWRHEVDDGQREREDLEKTVATLERQVEEGQESSSSMRRRLEKLHADMATAAGQLASEKSTAKAKEDDYRLRCESLEAQHAAESRQRHELEEELRVLHGIQSEVAGARLALGTGPDTTLEELVRDVQSKLAEQQSLAARYERGINDARESGLEQMSMGPVADAAVDSVDPIKAKLEMQLAEARVDLESVRNGALAAEQEHQRLLSDSEHRGREVIARLEQESGIALDDARRTHETVFRDLTVQQARALQHAVEDKERAEYFLNERLGLAEAKLQHSHDRVAHLQERLEVAKSAAQAVVMSAQSKTSGPLSRSNALPEKVSPQALRESILVLQEQLQDREAHIERLQNLVQHEGPAKLKERDSEITWLRELLSVRSEDLTELVNTLAQPDFERDAVRDIAIRIRANLQMEQQEKERFGYRAQSLGSQALSSLSSFVTPKAPSLTSAFNKWRSTMESSSLRNVPQSAPVFGASTPSRRAAASRVPPGYAAGLMTPPASNLRQTPSPELTKPTSRPCLPSAGTTTSQERASRMRALSSTRRASVESDDPTTPLFREQSYDRDADVSKVHMQEYEDDDLDVPDTAPPAFRSLQDELLDEP